MSSSKRASTTIPLHGLSLDFATFSAMSYFASEMNIPLNDAIHLALQDWLTDLQYPGDGIQN